MTAAAAALEGRWWDDASGVYHRISYEDLRSRVFHTGCSLEVRDRLTVDETVGSPPFGANACAICLRGDGGRKEKRT